jgi:hypothetical protein
MQAILEQSQIAQALVRTEEESFGGRIGLLATLFGCWHKRLSRPFMSVNSRSKAEYRACLDCGARKKFDSDSLKTYGSFYYPPKVSVVSKG